MKKRKIVLEMKKTCIFFYEEFFNLLRLFTAQYTLLWESVTIEKKKVEENGKRIF